MMHTAFRISRGVLVAMTLAALATVGSGRSAAAAKTAPVDVTGHWTGTYHSAKGSGQLSADFTAAADLQTFTGTFTVLDATGQQVKGTFTVQGTLARNSKLTAQLTSTDLGDTGTAVVSGILNRRTLTVKGPYHSQDGGGGHGKDHGTFVLTKQAQ